jgi:hypothetical protein
MKQVFDYLTSPGSPRLVVLSFYGYYAEATDVAADHLQNGFGPSHYQLYSDDPQQTKEEVLVLGLGNAIKLLLSRNKTVFLITDIPELPFFPRDCIKRPFMKQKNCYVARAAVDQRQRGLRRVVNELQHEFPQIAIFDPLPLLCGEISCNPVNDDFSFYQDSHHLSVRGSETVARSLLTLIDQRFTNGAGAER